MSREYVISAGGITLANQAVTLASLMPSATIGFEILRAWVAQSANNTSAQQRVQLVTQVTAFPTVVTATPAKTKFTDPSSGIAGIGGAIAAGKCGINASAEGAGAKTVIWEDAFNVLNGWLWVPNPEEKIVLPPGIASCFSLFFPVASATLTNWAFGIVFREL
jgi:hypothetical protein